MSTNDMTGITGDPLSSALNAGTIGIRCYINRSCPFTQASKDEKDIVFNERTLAPFQDLENKSIKQNLTGTPGTEGIHFLPYYIYRHGYIYRPKDTQVKKTIFTTQIKDPSLTSFDDFEDNYTEISSGMNFINGVNQTRYKPQQTWVIVNSVFDDYKNPTNISDDIISELCGTDTIWSYANESISSNHDIFDKKFDYKTPYFSQNTTKSANGNYVCKINTNHVQMPRQYAARNQAGSGNHWRLQKRTPLYKGEDFFIAFKPTAPVPNISSTDETRRRFRAGSGYNFIDTTLNPDLNYIDMDSGRYYNEKKAMKGPFYPVNWAVTPRNSSDTTASNSYYLYDQPYYVIEMGMGDADNHYFIILCERAKPLFVHAYKGVSFPLGQCETVNCKKLFSQAKGFQINVRNHLGKLVIEFGSDGQMSEPWIISKTTYDGKTDELLFVPRGHMSIWGGNMQSGFLFGPIQYSASSITMEYPPSNLDKESRIANARNRGNNDRVFEVDLSNITPTPKWFSLPIGLDHKILLTCSTLVESDLTKYQSVQKNKNKSLYTQDSQFYREDGSGDQLGYLFWQQPIKELCATYSSVNWTKDSYIRVGKCRHQEDKNRRLENFTISIDMVVGDHIFINKSVAKTTAEPRSKMQDYNNFPTLETVIDDTIWYLPACKTPILTQVRLVADNPKSTRWNDGTGIEEGVKGEPHSIANINQDLPILTGQYAIDASTHLMLYSESWNASDFFTIEHTASLTFLLNEGFTFGLDLSSESRTRPPGETPNGSTADITKQIEALKDKAFYVEIWAEYQPLLNTNETRADNFQNIRGLAKLFTGICHGGSIETKLGSKIMTCKATDYMKVLKDQYFYNSPFFDGMLSSAAVYEILIMAGFREKGTYDPASILSQLTLNPSYMKMQKHTRKDKNTKRTFIHTPYALPSGYSRLEQPAYKFQDGSTYYDAIAKICNDSGKCFYFDQYGVAHFEDYMDLIRAETSKEFTFDTVWDFTTNPDENEGQMIFNKVERGYNVSEIYNHLKVVSNTPDMQLLVFDDINYASYEEPDAEGFLGYRKSYIQHEGMFGSEQNVRDQIGRMKAYFRPAINLDFETYGVPIRALDFVNVDGESVRVMSVDNNFDPRDNKWWMTVKCEKYLPIQ